MALILNIETATTVCSVALCRDGQVVENGIEEVLHTKDHASQLTVFIEKIMERTGIKLSEIDAVAVSKGPGSYTGLRIGVSTAKGIAYALDKPLISVCTLKSLAVDEANGLCDVSRGNPAIFDTLFCPMIDARRMDVYTAVYNFDFELLHPISAVTITPDSFKELLDKQTIIFIGEGSIKCRDVITHRNAIFNHFNFPSARSMARLSERAYQNHEFEDIAYFEPFYLKDFVATIPKNKVF